MTQPGFLWNVTSSFPLVSFMTLLSALNVKCCHFCHLNELLIFDVYFLRHGLGRTDFYILNDPELSFRDTVNKNVMSAVSSNVLKAEFMSPTIKPDKLENDILRVDQNQIVVKLEKGEGTLQIEKVGGTVVKKEQQSDETVSVDISFVKTEPEESAPTPTAPPASTLSRSSTPAPVPSPAETAKPEVVAEVDNAEPSAPAPVENESEETEPPAVEDKTVVQESASADVPEDSPTETETENATPVSKNLSFQFFSLKILGWSISKSLD